MRQFQHRIAVETRGKGFYDITSQVRRAVAQSGIVTGLLTVFLQHTSASLVIQENADPDVLHDLNTALGRLAPEDNRLYRHTMEGPDDMPAHIRTAITSNSLAIPVMGGRLALGVWQAIYVAEHRDSRHQRGVVLHLIGDGGDNSEQGE